MISNAALNACLNGLSGVLLACGYAAIRAGKKGLHKAFMLSVPLIIVTLRRAWLGRFDKHRLIARWTLPLWFYVSVTGVIIYFMVYQIFVPKIP
ncbi:MAG: hypothetical protein DMG42_18850 [Acidobacteria bacterium]|nr:MAG: hypothetical protein DMG42_18850 [Acidobacteriota bacterium]